VIPRTALHLWALELASMCLVVLPVVAAIHAVTGHLPEGLTLLGSGGPPVIADAYLRSPLVPGAAVASLVVLGLEAFLLAPLLLAGTVRCLAGEARSGPGLAGIVTLGARGYPRYLALQAVYVVALATGGIALALSVGPVAASVAFAILLFVLSGLRDVAAVAFLSQGSLREALARIPSLLMARPLAIMAGHTLEVGASWALFACALRLELAVHSECMAGALVAIVVTQPIQAVRCLVRCSWLAMLQRIGS